MKSSLTDSLCTRCGLCCDGSLFADVELAPSDDSAALEVLGLEVEDDDDRARGELLIQPCAGLRNRRCSLYPHRPQCCRTFECRLLGGVRQGTMPMSRAEGRITEALGRIQGVRELVGQLGTVSTKKPWKEAVLEILALTENATDPAVVRARDALEKAMGSLEKHLQRTFLAAH